METYNFVMCLHKLLVEKIKEKVPGKVEECIFEFDHNQLLTHPLFSLPPPLTRLKLRFQFFFSFFGIRFAQVVPPKLWKFRNDLW